MTAQPGPARPQPEVPALTGPPPLTPVQQEVLDQLGSTHRPRFRDDLRDHLHAELTEALAPSAAGLAEPLFVTKHKLALVHGCQTRFLADGRQPFAWTPAAARGVVAHKAIELLVGWRGAPTPLDLVDEAIASLERDEFASVRTWLTALSEGERAELVAAANDKVAAFLDSFPPLDRRWRPVTEARVRADLCDDRIRLHGKIDLTLGYARNGNEAGRVLVDLKTGGPQPGHVEDLRFYALLEALRSGVPPRLLVNYYLEAGRPRTEAVTEDLLWSAARRLVDGITTMVALVAGDRAATRVPSGGCRWCPVLADCDDGRRHLAHDDGTDDEP
jgi:hypothetical protein